MSSVEYIYLFSFTRQKTLVTHCDQPMKINALKFFKVFKCQIGLKANRDEISEVYPNCNKQFYDKHIKD